MQLKIDVTKQNQYRLGATHLPLAPSHNEFELFGVNEMSCFKRDIVLPGGMRGKPLVKKILISFLEKLLWGFFLRILSLYNCLI